MATHPHLALVPGSDGTARATGPIKVVLADDHNLVRRNLRLLLEREADLQVVAEASDLSAVAAQVTNHAPHVLVLDLRLPNGSSAETIRRLRAAVPETRVVVLTMEASPAFAASALEAGATGFVLKDHADSELVGAIRAAVRGEEYVSPRVAAALAALRRVVEGDELTPRETEILRLIALGHTNAEIAQRLHLSRRTVETHRGRIQHKLGLQTRAELVQWAIRRRLLRDA